MWIEKEKAKNLSQMQRNVLIRNTIRLEEPMRVRERTGKRENSEKKTTTTTGQLKLLHMLIKRMWMNAKRCTQYFVAGYNICVDRTCDAINWAILTKFAIIAVSCY